MSIPSYCLLAFCFADQTFWNPQTCRSSDPKVVDADWDTPMRRRHKNTKQDRARKTLFLNSEDATAVPSQTKHENLLTKNSDKFPPLFYDNSGSEIELTVVQCREPIHHGVHQCLRCWAPCGKGPHLIPHPLLRPQQPSFPANRPWTGPLVVVDVVQPLPGDVCRWRQEGLVARASRSCASSLLSKNVLWLNRHLLLVWHWFVINKTN